jgi:hypothetical protein
VSFTGIALASARSSKYITCVFLDIVALVRIS